MRNLSKFEVFSEFKKYSFYFVDCSKIGVDRKMLLSLYDEFTEFCKRFHITIEKLIVYIDKLGILNKDLFDFSAYGSKESYLFAKNAIYTTKYVTEYGCQKKVVTKYNVYVVPNLYVNLALSKIAREVVLDVFPFLNDDVFCGKQRRFKDNINGLPVNLNTLQMILMRLFCLTIRLLLVI